MDITPDTTGHSGPDDPPSGVTYEVIYNDEHILGLWRRLRQLKRRSRMFMRVFRVLAGLVLGGLIVLVLAVGRWQHWYLAVALLGILGVLIFSEQIDGWLVVRRWRKGLHRGTRARLAFSPDGLSGQSDLSQSSMKWAAFSAAQRFPDGFLIFSGPYLPYWFPDAALVQGTASDAAALFKANIPNYKET